jgi:hypothetical protein
MTAGKVWAKRAGALLLVLAWALDRATLQGEVNRTRDFAFHVNEGVGKVEVRLEQLEEDVTDVEGDVARLRKKLAER